jgi:ABC-type sugar transport system substrate-binding protein
MQGVEQAVASSGLDVAMIGLAGTNYALDQVRAGKWYGDVALFPITAGQLAGEAMLRHVADPTLAGETISPLLKGVGPMFTKDNIDTYDGQYD